MHASTLVLLVTSPLNVLLNYLLVYRTSLGFLGAPVATSITYWLSFGLLCGEFSPLGCRSFQPNVDCPPRRFGAADTTNSVLQVRPRKRMLGRMEQAVLAADRAVHVAGHPGNPARRYRMVSKRPRVCTQTSRFFLQWGLDI